jgi:hypothetical protein
MGDIFQPLINRAQTAVKQIEDNANTVERLAPSVVLNIQNAPTQTAQAKATISGGQHALSQILNEANSLVSSRLRASESSASRTEIETKEVARLRKDVKEARELYKVRKEQAEALTKRNESNFHSSWMGLWRPLRPESRTGLMVASMVMGVAALLGMLFMIAIRYNVFPDFTAPGTTVSLTLTGGSDIVKEIFHYGVKAMETVFVIPEFVKVAANAAGPQD